MTLSGWNIPDSVHSIKTLPLWFWSLLLPPFLFSVLISVTYYHITEFINLWFSRRDSVSQRCFNPYFTSLSSSPTIRLLLKGSRKFCPLITDSRPHMTFSILHTLIMRLRVGLCSHYVNTLQEAILLLVFYGFLRCCEFTVSSPPFISSCDLCDWDISFCTSTFSFPQTL